MKILAYKGVGLVSKAIQWQTRSPYSHIGIQLFCGHVIEAWHVGGVQRNPAIGSVHEKGTKVDVFRIDYEYEPTMAKVFLLNQLGKDYDFNAIFRFLSRRNEPTDNKWFCSELAMAAFPFLLDRIPPSHVSPGMLVLSPYLKFEHEYICKYRGARK